MFHLLPNSILGEIHEQHYTLGVPNAPMAVTGKTEATGSTIHFKPSPEVFAITEFK
jgi:DNA gyrase subunit B